jgi:AcrR family transcriptional regulator
MNKGKIPSDERRRQILLKARHVFAERGYAGARTRDIAAACDVNEAMLYQHFKAKEELFLEVMNQVHDECTRIARSELEPEMRGLEIVRQMIYSLWRDFASEYDLIANIVHSMDLSLDNEKHRHQILVRFSKHHEKLTEAIEQGIKDGSIKPEIDAPRFASMILSLGLIYSILKATDLADAFKARDPLPVFDMVLDCLDVSKPSHF